MFKTLSKSIREYKRESILSPVSVIIEVFFESLLPFYTARLVSNIENGAGMDVLLKSGAVILIIAMSALVFGIISGKYAAVAATGFAKNLRKDMFGNIQDFSFANINKFTSASLVTRLTTDISNVQMAYMMLIRPAIRFPIMFIISFVMAYIMGGKMAFIFLLVAPLLILSLLLIMRAVMPKFKAVFKKYDNINKSIQENIKGIRVVKAYVQEDYEREKFNDAAEDLRKDFTSAEKIIALTSPIFETMLNLVMIFVLTIGSYVTIKSKGMDFQVGQMSALLTYSFQILNSLMILSMLFVMFSISKESANRIAEVLEEKTDMTNGDDPSYEIKDGSINFKDVFFSYENEENSIYQLEDINLDIESGETVGIIGPTGSAKSSLVQLIPRLYDVSRGVVEVAGKDVRDYDLKTLRDNISIVLQKNILFSGTIKENLRWGDKDASDEELIEACKLAQAHDFIMEFEDGYDTFIEQGGSNVSGGQKQRLSIARSLLRKPKILILDDSTSAVDTKTDAMIRQGLKNYLPDTTKIIIAQRIASVQEADKIVVMDNGKIDMVGNHDYLLNNSDLYKEIYTSQTKVGDDNA